MINYPPIEHHTKSNREFDSAPPKQKPSPNGEPSFEELTTDRTKKPVEAKVLNSEPQERAVNDENGDGESVVIKEAAPPTEFSLIEVPLQENLFQITQNPIDWRQFSASYFEDESEFQINVELALAVANAESPSVTSLVKVVITDELRTLLADSPVEAAELKLATKQESSPQSSPDPTSIPDSAGAKITTSFVEKEMFRDARIEMSSSETARVVTRRVSETLIREIPLVENDGFRRITLKLHPAELGKLTLYVGWENETVKAQIVASEIATSEMLNREKNHLLETMHAQGMKLDSFDVSYEGSTQNRNDWKTHRKLPFDSDRELSQVEQALTVRPLGTHGSVVDIIV